MKDEVIYDAQEIIYTQALRYGAFYEIIFRNKGPVKLRDLRIIHIFPMNLGVIGDTYALTGSGSRIIQPFGEASIVLMILSDLDQKEDITYGPYITYGVSDDSGDLYIGTLYLNSMNDESKNTLTSSIPRQSSNIEYKGNDKFPSHLFGERLELNWSIRDIMEIIAALKQIGKNAQYIRGMMVNGIEHRDYFIIPEPFTILEIPRNKQEKPHIYARKRNFITDICAHNRSGDLGGQKAGTYGIHYFELGKKIGMLKDIVYLQAELGLSPEELEEIRSLVGKIISHLNFLPVFSEPNTDIRALIADITAPLYDENVSSDDLESIIERLEGLILAQIHHSEIFTFTKQNARREVYEK